MSEPLVSVLVPVRNKRGQLERCLAALWRQTLPTELFEVIAVDDHSTDGSDEVLAREAQRGRLLLLRRRCNGPAVAKARNQGLEACRAKYCLFLDADVVAPPSLLETLIDLACDRREVILVPTLGSSMSDILWPLVAPPLGDDLDPEDQQWRFVDDPRLVHARGIDGDLNHLPAPWVFCWTTAVFLTTSMARSVGGFDGNLPAKGSEDIEFGLRLMDAGSRFRLAGPKVFHLPHSRDRRWEEQQDHEHERLILRSHPRRDVEMFCAFDASNTNAAYELLGSLQLPLGPWEALKELRLVLGHSLLFFGGDDGLRAALEPDAWLGSTNGANGGLPLLGISLPFADGHFDTAVLPDLRGWLPEGLICRFLQEAWRVAGRVLYLLYDPPGDRHQLVDPSRWRVIDRPYWERSIYISRSYHDWRGRPMATSGRVSGLRVLTVEPAGPWGAT